jgi:glycosyltransferase involved in cell wall biosynthesis
MPSALFVTTVPITLEAFLLPFADHFRAAGWRVDALANGATTNPQLDGHFDSRFDVAWSRNPLAPSNLLGTSRCVREIVVAGGYDIIHVHTPIASFVTRWALRRERLAPGGPRVIYTCHGFHFYRGQSPLPHAFFRTLERSAAHWTDYLVTVNQQDFEAALRFSGIAAGRVRLIPGIGVDTTRFAPGAIPAEKVATVRAELLGESGREEAGSRVLVTMVAELTANKRHALALDALARTREGGIQLALVGTGPIEDDIRNQVSRLGLEDRVMFASYRTDIPAVLSASDALLLTSEREGLNRSCLEAMSSGIPVIGTDTRGITDAVGEDQRAGWLAPHSGAAALARAIDEAASDPAERARRGAAARERAQRLFALPIIVHAYEELYGEALASRV